MTFILILCLHFYVKNIYIYIKVVFSYKRKRKILIYFYAGYVHFFYYYKKAIRVKFNDNEKVENFKGNSRPNLFLFF